MSSCVEGNSTAENQASEVTENIKWSQQPIKKKKITHFCTFNQLLSCTDYPGFCLLNKNPTGLEWIQPTLYQYILAMLCLAAQSCPTLCRPMHCSPSGSSVHGILRQEYWSGLPSPPPGDLPNPGIEPRSPTLQADSLPSELPGQPHKYILVNRFFFKKNLFLVTSKISRITYLSKQYW